MLQCYLDERIGKVPQSVSTVKNDFVGLITDVTVVSDGVVANQIDVGQEILSAAVLLVVQLTQHLVKVHRILYHFQVVIHLGKTKRGVVFKRWQWHVSILLLCLHSPF